ncbi:uncharacterized protein FOMMEDRAFT_162983 [Fomitiporia mediterranea MF3/22]|uniref:Uncharacterized protein n=1 Tax=Fomitiporia mediterranea (strain MF3/22) TaxID=694068 RepID=R7SIT6_FOMME|nr:uncharacterized protein FOMMEDRAFT_162983 [Fomitiporia mediterranea MF3/22]EJC97524.1 hypothetical protein FOMMEDRAFT_162983 [Fomitiporia mediterranea MF3/22]
MLQAHGSSESKRPLHPPFFRVSVKSTPLADVSSIVDARSSKRTMLRDSSCLTLVAPIALLSDMERALDGLILRFFVDPDLSFSSATPLI